MKAIISTLGILILAAGPAMAGRNANGAMVLHTDDAVSYSIGWNYCAEPTPTDCLAMVTQINKDPAVEAIVWVIAHWCPNASPGVTQFQFGIYGDVPYDRFTAWEPCGPPLGWIETPDQTWPSPGAGTLVVYAGNEYPIQAMKMYWFAVTGQTGWALGTGSYPHGDMHAEFLDDTVPPLIDYCFNFGTVRWGTPGMNECQDCGPEACCFVDGHCEMLTADACSAAGGYPGGEGTTCDMVQCEPTPTKTTTWGHIKSSFK